LQSGDENIKSFQAYAKGRKMANTIRSLNDPEGRLVSSFEGLARLGKEHFQNLFKEDMRVSMEGIVIIALYFPIFVEEDENRALME
jgi:hypothetical protein